LRQKYKKGLKAITLKPACRLVILAPQTGLEPVTYGLTEKSVV
jgi:hypothetical protein